MEKQRGVEVFIVRESGESANTARHARRGGANPDKAAPGLEAVRRALFTRTHIILKTTNLYLKCAINNNQLYSHEIIKKKNRYSKY